MMGRHGVYYCKPDGLARRTLETFDALGNSTAFSYDPLDRLTGMIDARGDTTGFGYDADSNLLNVTDANSNKTSYTYESMDRRAKSKDALLATASYSYDYNGNLTQVTDRRGKVSKYQYDGLNRRTFAGFGWNGSSYESSITYSYDGGNRLTQAVDSLAGTLTRQYDGLDNLIQEVTPLGTVNAVYDLARRRATVQVVGQRQVSNGFDNSNRLTSVTQSGQSVGLNYDSANRRTCLTLPNGVIASYGYDNDSRITSITYGTGGSCASPPNNLGNLTYTYDADGRRLSVGGSLAAVTLPANVAGGSSTTYNADNEQTNFNGTSPSGACPERSRRNANGNLTGDRTYTYAYDSRNQLNQINQITHGGKVVASIGYDGLGRRQTKVVNGTTTQFLYDGLNPLQELNGATPPAVTANLLTGLSIDEYFTRTDSSGNVSSFLRDALGSTLGLVTASNGPIATSYTYEPFGATTVGGSANGNSYEFTGRENDGTGLYFYRARYYSPTYQRFVSQDPMDVGAGDPNLYAYVGDDSADLKDPLGLDAYLCDRPIKGTSREIGPSYHQFICVVLDHATYCFGLTTYNKGTDFPGSLFNVPGSLEGDAPNQSCKKQSTKRRVDSCLLGVFEQPAPDYGVFNLPGSMNCHKFATSAVAYCQTMCANSSN